MCASRTATRPRSGRAPCHARRRGLLARHMSTASKVGRCSSRRTPVVKVLLVPQERQGGPLRCAIVLANRHSGWRCPGPRPPRAWQSSALSHSRDCCFPPLLTHGKQRNPSPFRLDSRCSGVSRSRPNADTLTGFCAATLRQPTASARLPSAVSCLARSAARSIRPSNPRRRSNLATLSANGLAGSSSRLRSQLSGWTTSMLPRSKSSADSNSCFVLLLFPNSAIERLSSGKGPRSTHTGRTRSHPCR